MGVGDGLYMYDVVVKSSRSLSLDEFLYLLLRFDDDLINDDDDDDDDDDDYEQ